MPAVGVLAFDERAAPRFEQIFLGREELVARDERPAAHARGGEVDQTLAHQVHTVIAPISRSRPPETLRDRTRTPLARTSVARLGSGGRQPALRADHPVVEGPRGPVHIG